MDKVKKTLRMMCILLYVGAVFYGIGQILYYTYTVYSQFADIMLKWLKDYPILAEIWNPLKFFLKAAWFLETDTPSLQNFPSVFKKDWLTFLRNRYPLSYVLIALLIYQYAVSLVDMIAKLSSNKFSFRKSFLVIGETHYNFLVWLTIPVILVGKIKFFPAIFWCKLYAKSITLLACWKNGVIAKEKPVRSFGKVTILFMLVELFFYLIL